MADQHKLDMKKWREAHPDYQKKWAKKNVVSIRKTKFKRKYNLLYEDWLKMWESQNGKCAICGKSFSKPSNACVDHNHETGNVRGLICKNCNFGIGYFKDNPKFIFRAFEYLMKGDPRG